MATIRINQLPEDNTPNPNDVVPLDNGTTRNTTVQQLVDTGAPVASQGEAEAGENATKRMTPLTTKQAIEHIGAQNFATLPQLEGQVQDYINTTEEARDDAESARDAAIIAQGLAEAAQTGAETAQGLAESARDDAEDARDVAMGFRNEAQTARDFAARWASDPEDSTPIDDGTNPPGQSAFHWAKKSEAEADRAEDAKEAAEDAKEAAEEAAAGVEYPVSYAPQTLSPEQQEQARDNIDALARDGSDVGDATAQATFRRAIGADILPGFLCGFSIATNVSDADHDIDFGAGVCASAAADPVRMSVSAMTKRSDATFAEGHDNGGMVDGESLPTNGTIHLWAITKADGTGDFCFNNHASSGLAPTLPTGFIHKRRVGSLRTDGSANIIGVIQRGDVFWYADGIGFLDVDVLDHGTSGVMRTLTVPLGLDGLTAITNSYVSHDDRYAHLSAQSPAIPVGGAFILDPPLSAVAIRANASGATVGASSRLDIAVNTSGQIVTVAGHANTAVRIATLGYRDDRGRSNGFFI